MNFGSKTQEFIKQGYLNSLSVNVSLEATKEHLVAKMTPLKSPSGISFKFVSKSIQTPYLGVFGVSEHKNTVNKCLENTWYLVLGITDVIFGKF